MKSFISIFIILFAVLTTKVCSQNTYGIFGYYGLNRSTAQFKKIPFTQSCCGGFTDGTGNAMQLGILYKYNITNQLQAGLRAGYLYSSFDLRNSEQTRVIINGIGAKGEFEYSLQGALSYLYLQPGITYIPFPSWYFTAGIDLLQPINSWYEQKEKIIEPQDIGTFIDSNGQDSGSRIRNLYKGNLPSVLFQTTLSATIGHSFSLNKEKSLHLMPEVSLSLPFMSVIESVQWKNIRIMAGLALTVSTEAQSDSIQYRRDTLYLPASTVQIAGYYPGIEKSNVEHSGSVSIRKISVTDTIKTWNKAQSAKPTSLAIKPMGISDDGSESADIILKAEEYNAIMMTPLLSYVFFQPGSSLIQPEYKLFASPSELDNFTPEKVNSTAKLPTYYHLLNITGYRMKLYPESRLILTGCTDEQGIEKGNIELARQRAEQVRQYLLTIWGINPDRISIKTRLLPEKPSKTQNDEGYAENRRVELMADMPEILAPVITKDTMIVLQPKKIRWYLNSANSTKTWSLKAYAGQETVFEYTGSTDIPSSVETDISTLSSPMLRNLKKLDFSLNSNDKLSGKDSVGGFIPINYISVEQKQKEKMDDKEIERYSLILFDISSAEITGQNIALTELIRKSIKNDSKVFITGFTDRVGNTESNQKLAESRARSTAEALGISPQNIIVKAKGNTDLYKPQSPEGRLYSRTVEIVIETPVHQ
jgi:outer membrane protein OmpA-like peptidoglycan-associated protein